MQLRYGLLAELVAVPGKGDALADDWKENRENRQTCIDVLCAYLRLPYDPDPGDDTEPDKLPAYRANREVRHTIIRLIGAHLRPGAPVSWQGLNLDFTSVIFDGGDFSYAEFSGGEVNFDGADFSGGTVSFGGAEFSRGSRVDFTHSMFSGGAVDFSQAQDWSHPPAFGPGFDEASPPPGVTLPTAAGPSPDTPAPTTKQQSTGS
jgi:hypothetical protein